MHSCPNSSDDYQSPSLPLRWIDVDDASAVAGRLSNSRKTIVRSHARIEARRRDQRARSRNQIHGTTSNAATSGGGSGDRGIVRSIVYPYAQIAPYIAKSDISHRMILATYVDVLFGANLLNDADVNGIVDLMANRSSRAARSAYNTLALLQIGLASENDYFVSAGRTSHIEAVQCLRHGIQQVVMKNATATEIDDMVSSAHALLACETYEAISSGLEVWDRQLRGIVALFQARESHRDAPQFHKTRRIVTISCLARRIRLPGGLNFWRDTSRMIQPGSIEELSELALRLPMLLECTYAGSAVKWGTSSMAGELSDLESGLSQWHADFESCYEKQASMDFGLEPATGRATLVSVERASIMAFYNICCLLVESCRSRLYGSLRACDSKEQQHGDAIARSLCEIVSDLFQSPLGLPGKLLAIAGPLHFAAEHFIWRELVKEVQICQDLRESVAPILLPVHISAIVPWSSAHVRPTAGEWRDLF